MSTSRVLNVAVIGAGEVAMCIHLPTLTLMSHMYEVMAIVDVSKQAVEHCARKFNIPRTFTDVGDMLAACSDADVVVMCHSDEFHAGKHVFIEKPMAQTLREADEIEAARLASGKLVFVGYMRRYATAFLRVKKVVQELDPAEINYDGIISQNATFPQQFSDIPTEASAERRRVATSQFEELTGLDFMAPVSQYIRACKFHISPHDLSLMRELFGVPQQVISAIPSARGNFIAILFQYEGFVVAYETPPWTSVLNKGESSSPLTRKPPHCRQWLMFRPYIKGLPITATILSRHPDGDFSQETIRPTYEDYYTLQFKEMYRCLVDGAAIKTTVLDSREDIALTGDILQVLAQGFQKRQQHVKD
ncbi:hypothetical protein I312_103647 [Cryptococcus bacillisporus CA1280]|uniref:uncharacterized protein n=1 Tax=Cryptococcus bacillisporus CA1280 TaxID=1296109 RepID=UPI003366A8DA